MKLNEKQLIAAYVFLQHFPPFSTLKLPDPYRIHFKISKSNMAYGLYETDPHTITISKTMHSNPLEVLGTMAHEMVHLALERSKHGEGHEEHNEAFSNLAKQVCTSFGFEQEGF